MKTFKRILTYTFGIFMVFGGVNHFLKPEMYFPFFSEFLPKQILNYAIGIIEIGVGLAVFSQQWKKWATLCILVLMLAFLPLHIWDVFRDQPAIGSHDASLIRLPLQFVFIAWAWFIYKD